MTLDSETGYGSGLLRLDMALETGYGSEDWIWLWRLCRLDMALETEYGSGLLKLELALETLETWIWLWRLDMALETGYGSEDWIWL